MESIPTVHATVRPDEVGRLVELLNGDGESSDVRQTHISFVALTPHSAYKRLKPVRFDFLDFSTREARYVHLANEARLNRRLAASVYRGLVPLWRTDDDWQLTGSGPPDDWLLAMERLSESATLEAAVTSGNFDACDFDRIVATLTAFFQGVERSDEIAVNGAPAVLRRNLVENLDTLGLAAAHGRLGAAQVASLRSRQLQGLAWLDEELRARQRQGWIRNGHGDLRAEHVYLTDPVQIIDCIAFNHRLRWIDTADDVSFLATDLIRLGGTMWANRLIDGYRAAMNDPVSDRLLAFYRSYRFAVRAKVAVLRSQERADRANDDSQDAGRYLDFATEALSEVRPLLIVVCGLSGTGKTTIAAALAERIGSVHLSSDRIRKEIHGRAPTDRTSSESLYSAEANETTYRELLRRAGQRLSEATGVVLDATFLRRSDRNAVESLADEFEVHPLFVECRCSEPEVERRLAGRAAHGDDPSDATFDIWRRQHTISDGYAGLSPARHLVVDSTRKTVVNVDEIVMRLKDR